jgi:hypothetical protein
MANYPLGGKSHFARNLAITLVMGCLTDVPGMASEEDDEIPTSLAGACTATADAGLKACRFEAQDNYWLAIGNCDNLSDPNARKQCASAASTAQNDAFDLCGAQRVARLQVCQKIGEAPYDPKLDPAMFVSPAKIGSSVAPNRFFPLVPGRTWVYKEKGGTQTATVTVTKDTETIVGIPAAAVHDVVRDNGEVIGDTTDWYAQDIQGNVWYMGQISQQFKDGELVGLEGSWQAGRESDKPGIQMKANPAVGQVYRQEFSFGNAEDIAEVTSLTGTAGVPGASCRGNCLVTKETTPLTPAALEAKYYAPGVGMILGVDRETGQRTELVEVRN